MYCRHAWILPDICLPDICFLAPADKFTTGFNSEAEKLYTDANQTVTDAFSSIRVIHAYNLQVSESVGWPVSQPASPSVCQLTSRSHSVNQQMQFFASVHGWSLKAAAVVGLLS